MTDNNRTKLVKVERLRPNSYNPNQMDPLEFKELVAEVKHLGRLPKPVIVRKNGRGFEIVDGEHGWRAAKQLGLPEVTCEIIDADDFESMRQTYKRNQHGEHNPVLLGRMFQSMMAARALSRRKLATETGVSEGTIRNAVAYAKAAKLRNSYADGNDDDRIAGLSIRQVRAYLELPREVRDTWLVAGADLRVLEPYDCNLKAWFDPLVEAGLAESLDPHRGRFAPSLKRAFELCKWYEKNSRYFGDGELREFMRPVAESSLPVWVIDEFLWCDCDLPGPVLKPYMTAERWREVLEDCCERAEPDSANFKEVLGASMRLAAKQLGKDPADTADPRLAEVIHHLQDAPEAIRNADFLTYAERWEVACLAADLPNELAESIVANVLDTLRGRHETLTGEGPIVEMAKAAWAGRTIAEMFKNGTDAVARDHEHRHREALFSDEKRLLDAVISDFEQWHATREGEVDGMPALSVLRERLLALPSAEFRLLASLVLSDGFGAPSRWLKDVGGSVKQPCEA